MKVSTTGKWVWSPALQCSVSFPSFWRVSSSTVSPGCTTRLKLFVPTKHCKVCTLEDAIRELPIMFSQNRKKTELVLALFPSISVPFIYFEQIVLKFIVNCLSYRTQTYPHGDE